MEIVCRGEGPRNELVPTCCILVIFLKILHWMAPCLREFKRFLDGIRRCLEGDSSRAFRREIGELA
jgi:hypothetical protein